MTSSCPIYVLYFLKAITYYFHKQKYLYIDCIQYISFTNEMAVIQTNGYRTRIWISRVWNQTQEDGNRIEWFVLLLNMMTPWKRFHHDDVIKWKHFPRYWPFVRGIHRSPVNSPHKGQWRGALMFSLIWLSKQWWGWWFEALSCPLWRHCNVMTGDWWGKSIGEFASQRAKMPSFNTLRPRQMDAISQMTFLNAFSWMKMHEFRLIFHWSLFLWFELTIFQHWFR